MKIGDPGNCVECGSGIVRTCAAKKYCASCIKDKEKADRKIYKAKLKANRNGNKIGDSIACIRCKRGIIRTHPKKKYCEHCVAFKRRKKDADRYDRENNITRDREIEEIGVKHGDLAKCAQCNIEIIIKSSRHTYCTDCAADRIKKYQKDYHKAHYNDEERIRARERHDSWVAKNPDKYKARLARASAKTARLIQLAKASIELMPSLEELL